MRRAMRVMTASVLSLGLVAAVVQAERPHVREAKGSGVTFHAASYSPADGLRKATLAGEAIYVSPAPIANSMDILETGIEGQGMSIRLSGDAANRLSRQGEQVAVFINDKLVSAGPVGIDGRVSVLGLSADQADRISRAVQGHAIPVAGPVLALLGSLWKLVAGIVAIRQALDFSTSRAILTAFFGFMVVVVFRLVVRLIF